MEFPQHDWREDSPAARGVDAAKLAAALAVLRGFCGADGDRQTVIVRDGVMIHRGPDIDTLHSIWSCTKSFLSTALGLLLADGRCTLATRAAAIHPPLEVHYPTLTLRHLATFTCGYRPRAASADEPPFDPAPPLFAPGERFHYGWGPYLLALLLTKVAGESLADLFRRRVAAPIGLDPAAWRWGDWGPLDALTGLHNVPICGGSGLYDRGVAMTARALARVGWLFACGGQWAGRQLVEAAWAQEATRTQVPATTPAHEPDAWYKRLPGTYGYFWWTNGTDARGRRMWPAAPPGTFGMQGHLNNVCWVIPEWRMVVVRLGMDVAIDNDRYDGFFAALGEAVGRKQDI